jgi:ATP-binding cassette subfamily B protein
MVQSLCTISLAIFIVVHATTRGLHSGATLLFAYWASTLPWLGQELAYIGRELPRYRTLLSRLLEPLRAKVDGAVATEAPAVARAEGPVGIAFEHVTVRAAGNTILEDLDLALAPGEHVAIVGPSGAGKSTFAALLLGLRLADAGQVLVDGQPLDGGGLAALRRRVAWVDPSVSLWNRSLIDNVRYGAPTADLALDSILAESDLVAVLERLPDGLQTELGEGGRLLSGGEGQRVRLARALTRASAGLVVLDEPFRGLELERRQRLLGAARTLWRGATLVCITHDVGATLDFDRVLVIEGGRLREAGAPSSLLARAHSRYAALVAAEHQTRDLIWNDRAWRRVRVENGKVHEGRDG